MRMLLLADPLLADPDDDLGPIERAFQLIMDMLPHPQQEELG